MVISWQITLVISIRNSSSSPQYRDALLLYYPPLSSFEASTLICLIFSPEDEGEDWQSSPAARGTLAAG